MRLLSFTTPPDNRIRLGVLNQAGAILDIADFARHTTLPFESNDMLSLIMAGKSGLDAMRAALPSDARAYAINEVSFLAPIPRPQKNIFCVGWNYLEHFAEGEKIRQSGQSLPEYPVFFSKAVTAINGPYADIPYSETVTKQLDWEAELGVIIGKRGKNIVEDKAGEYVFGYTIINDISARDLQKRHGGQWLKGKSLDGTCPMGPYIVTADELNYNNLRVACRVNGVTKQDSNTKHMYFKIPRLISELSLGMTLEAGDIISTGTPSGVGFARNPPEFLQPGDVVETEIEGIGIMRNLIGG